MKKFTVLALAFTAAAALAAPVLAGNDNASVPGGAWIGVDEVHKQLTALGYTRITEIERDDGRYEVDATSPEGHRVDLWLAGDTGKIVRVSRDDDEDDRFDD